jgi:hypothetical protein
MTKKKKTCIIFGKQIKAELSHEYYYLILYWKILIMNATTLKSNNTTCNVYIWASSLMLNGVQIDVSLMHRVAMTEHAASVRW